MIYQVENRFQSLPFRCNLQRYTEGAQQQQQPSEPSPPSTESDGAVRLCTLNQVDP
jgi:hypothetical protein